MTYDEAMRKAMRYLTVKGMLNGNELEHGITAHRALRLLHILGKKDRPVDSDCARILILWAEGKEQEVAMMTSDVPVQYYHNGESAKRRKKKGGGKHRHAHYRADRVGGPFLQSPEWRRLRMQALKLYGRKCQCCGATPATGAVLNVDHIKPRKFFPELALTLSNLQVLCHECNHGKGNWDMTDWRVKEQA